MDGRSLDGMWFDEIQRREETGTTGEHDHIYVVGEQGCVLCGWADPNAPDLLRIEEPSDQPLADFRMNHDGTVSPLSERGRQIAERAERG